ncbi:MAG: hypothetical protein ACP5QO_17390 [Clostridia bacterium]
MPARRYEAGDAVEVRAGSFQGRCGTVLDRAVDDRTPGRVLYQVHFSDDEPARWFVAGRLRKARSPAPG